MNKISTLMSTLSAFVFCALMGTAPVLAADFTLACPDPQAFHADGTSCGDKGCKFTAKLETNENTTLNFEFNGPQKLSLKKNTGMNLVAGTDGHMHISCAYSGQVSPKSTAISEYAALAQLPTDWTCKKDGLALSCSSAE